MKEGQILLYAQAQKKNLKQFKIEKIQQRILGLTRKAIGKSTNYADVEKCQQNVHLAEGSAKSNEKIGM